MDCIVLRSLTLSSDTIIYWRSLSIFRSFRYCDSVNVIYVIEFNVGKPGSGQIFEDFLYSAAQWNPILSERCQDAYQSHRIYLKAVESSEQGNCYDNAPIEIFWGILKSALVSHRHYRTPQEAIKDITEYIEFFYNRQRKQKKLGYLSPMAFERQYYEQQKAA